MKICIKGNEFNPSFISLYGEEKAKELGYTIYEAPVDCAFEDFDASGFNQSLYNARVKRENARRTNIPKIASLKTELAKCKEDVEQVELFGMTRDDYETKKSRCKEIIQELRKLEAEDVN